MVQMYKMKILNVATKNKLIMKDHQILILMLVQLEKDIIAEENEGRIPKQFEEGRMYYQT